MITNRKGKAKRFLKIRTSFKVSKTAVDRLTGMKNGQIPGGHLQRWRTPSFAFGFDSNQFPLHSRTKYACELRFSELSNDIGFSELSNNIGLAETWLSYRPEAPPSYVWSK